MTVYFQHNVLIYHVLKIGQENNTSVLLIVHTQSKTSFESFSAVTVQYIYLLW